MLLGSYTYGHSIDDSPGEASGDSEQFFPQDPRNLRAELASSDFDVRHRAVLSGIWELPFGQGRRSLNSLSGFANKLVEGWQLGGIWVISSGTPWRARAPGDRCYHFRC